MLRTLFSFTPFAVCLCWFMIFAASYRRNDSAKRMLTLFLATCVILYFCHGLFFTVGLSHETECIWTLCSLSVYPLYYMYLYRLTSKPHPISRIIMFLLPGFVVAFAKYLFPCELTDDARKLLNMVQIALVLYYGCRRLSAFDKELADVYDDVTGRDTRSIRNLLIAFVVTSLCSVVANALGRDYFAQNEWLILAVLSPFSVMLFILSYIGYTRIFSAEEFVSDIKEDNSIEETSVNDNLGALIEQLVVEEKYYLTPNLKITDVAKRVNSCRTYVSQLLLSGKTFLN